MTDPKQPKTMLANVPIREALSSTRRARILGLTLDDGIKGFFALNAGVSILVLAAICYSLLSQAVGFFPMNYQNISLYSHAGLQYVDYLRDQVEDYTLATRYLSDIRLNEVKSLQVQGKSDAEVADNLKAFDEFNNKFSSLIEPHQALLTEWATAVVDLDERVKSVGENVASRETLLKAGMKEKADEIKIETIDYRAETQFLRDGLSKVQNLNKSLAPALTELVANPPTLTTPGQQAKLAHIKQWSEEFIQKIPVIEAKMKSWDPLKPVPFYRAITGFFFGTEWKTNSFWQDWYGIVPLAVGSFCISLVALVIAVPFGISAAIYVNQIATVTEQNLIKPYIEFISAIPSVVLGFFGIAVLGNVLLAISQLDMLRWIPGFPLVERLNIFTAGCLLAFMSVPTIFTLAEDALNNVPRAYVEASTALGSTKLQTIIKIMVPAALSGIISAVLLGLGRVIGETMVVLLCAGNRIQIPDFTKGLTAFFQPAHTMTGLIAQEMGEVTRGGIQYRALFMLGAVLFFISLLINFLAQQVVKRYKTSIG